LKLFLRDICGFLIQEEISKLLSEKETSRIIHIEQLNAADEAKNQYEMRVAEYEKEIESFRIRFNEMEDYDKIKDELRILNVVSFVSLLFFHFLGLERSY